MLDRVIEQMAQRPRRQCRAQRDFVVPRGGGRIHRHGRAGAHALNHMGQRAGVIGHMRDQMAARPTDPRRCAPQIIIAKLIQFAREKRRPATGQQQVRVRGGVGVIARARPLFFAQRGAGGVLIGHGLGPAHLGAHKVQPLHDRGVREVEEIELCLGLQRPRHPRRHHEQIPLGQSFDLAV